MTGNHRSELAEYWGNYGAHARRRADPEQLNASFSWTKRPGHGPNAALLGCPSKALELGCAEGTEAAYLAAHGIDVTALDIAPAQVERARARWQSAKNLSFIEADAIDYLSETEVRVDAVYSIWGAVWFTDPQALVPLVHRVLEPGGIFAFSQPEPLPGSQGPQAAYGYGYLGRKLPLLRWNHTPETWRGILAHAGFKNIESHVLAAPNPVDVGTLIVRGHKENRIKMGTPEAL